ncbi:hypothetical protein AABB24_006326 [Solanum stoloniferum]|uniref:Uncharacterized protein n=1 Tax=Solanum stoloniferum TaxID=62892 RepID=A0ABD2V1T4_9SOLN|nr:uncharacterized protein LOC125832116 [Solanum verrucosum]
MANTDSTIWPNEQQPQQSVPYPEAVPNSAWHSSGSIGPFFAVISVLTILAILSCLVGRYCRNQERATPLHSIKQRDCSFGGLRGKLCWGSTNYGESTNNEGKGQDVV